MTVARRPESRRTSADALTQELLPKRSRTTSETLRDFTRYVSCTRCGALCELLEPWPFTDLETFVCCYQVKTSEGAAAPVVKSSDKDER